MTLTDVQAKRWEGLPGFNELREAGPMYLFSWNPKLWHWNIADSIQKITLTGEDVHAWACPRKDPALGAPFYLYACKAGIIGHGHIASAPFMSTHWDGSGREQRRVLLRFAQLLPLNLALCVKDTPIMGLQNSAQMNGALISERYRELLQQMWNGTTQKGGDNGNQRPLEEGHRCSAQEGNRVESFGQGIRLEDRAGSRLCGVGSSDTGSET